MTTYLPDAPADATTLRIGALPHDAQRDTEHLLDRIAQLKRASPGILGYPGNRDFDFSALGSALAVIPNNVGDPDDGDASDVTHTKVYEREVIAFLTQVAHGDPDHVYGCFCSSSSEGILFGLYTARRRLPRAPIYASSQAHYSIRKAADLLRTELVTVPSRPNGTMDPDALHDACVARRRRDLLTGRLAPRGAIVVATIGSTMTGSLDDPVQLRTAAAAAGEVHIHADAACGGLLAAFAENPRPWDFDAGVDSLQLSTHKVLGSPIPAGVVLARADLIPAGRAGEYVGSVSDRTLGCSRSGLAPLLTWAALRRLGTTGLCAQVRRCQETAAYAMQRLEESGWQPWRFDDSSITVVFDRPPQHIVDRWHLACVGDRCHLVAVSHVTRTSIDALCEELRL
ncbi:pyridoxal-dependent decarboxylase [Streptomyces sp. NPDC026673]|uniref:pyridoxal-dependent decarboxylase n=1 Tax=Streptomyces sp. NPDC026673 TaxID=3155724 RepID=UPI0033D03FFB